MPTDIARADVQRLVAQGAQLVEVLPREEYDDEHIPGALSIPLAELRRPSLDRARPVITYCQNAE